jgi:hypothetical protein
MVKAMARVTTLFALAAAAALSACAPTLGPPPPGGPRASGSETFRAQDFAWSTESGKGSVAGHVAYRQGKVRYSCAKATVILTPETPWTRKRMRTLYLSSEAAAEPADAVRARTPSTPGEDYSAYIRRTTCDASSRFSFGGLPEGAWYAITIAKPAAGGSGPPVALMKRVTTQNGKVTSAEL